MFLALFFNMFKSFHGSKKMWSYIAGGLKIKVICPTDGSLGPNQVGLL